MPLEYKIVVEASMNGARWDSDWISADDQPDTEDLSPDDLREKLMEGGGSSGGSIGHQLAVEASGWGWGIDVRDADTKETL